MTFSSSHIFVAGPRRVARRETILTLGPVDAWASCHARLRGPYAGMRVILPTIVRDAQSRWPDLTDRYRIALLYAFAELSDIIGPAPDSLVAVTPHEERTRYFGQSLIRSVSQGIITFLGEYGFRFRAANGRPLALALDDLHAADLTEREMVAVMVRRADPAVLRLFVGADESELQGELRDALATWTHHVQAADPPRSIDARTREELTRAFVDSDGTSDDPRELKAYESLPLDYRARLHDERADLLERAEGDPGLRLGAIPYHREHGNDPQGAGRAALRTALEHAVAVGYSAATVDYGMRGRLLCDPVLHQQDYCHFSAKAASALIPLGDLSKCAEIYHELQQRYALPRVHMTCSYAIAMLHTRFYEPRDHEVALGWLNNARALASLERDPVEGPYFQVYQDNGLALVEMHRGNLEHALELINKGIARLAREVPEDRYIVHRSQLLHNRARLLAALGRLEAAYADFTSLIEWDPWHVEYHTDRGNLSRRSGDLTAALADYDRAIEVSVPLPELYYNRATIRFDRGDVAGALADLDYLLDMEPGFAPARLLRATLRLDEGDTDGARHDVCAGLREQAGDPELTTLLGLVQQATGDKEGALASFNEALAADPGLVCALANRAALAFELGRIESSVDDLTCALERSGTDADLLFNRGFVLQHLGRYEEAVQDFTGALQAGGVDRPDALQHRATCLMEAGRVARAREDLQELRDLGCDERASAIEALFDSEESRAA